MVNDAAANSTYFKSMALQNNYYRNAKTKPI